MSEPWPAGGADLVQAIADTKLLLSHWYADQAFLGPNIADNIALFSLTQDEYGHVRQLYLQLEAQGRDADWLRRRPAADAYANAESTDNPAGSWTEFVVRFGLTDRAALLAIDALAHDDFVGLTEKIAEEEISHVDFHDGWLEHLAAAEPDAFEAALESTLPGVMAFLGPAGHDDGGDPLLSAGFTDRSVTELQEALLGHCSSVVAETGVSVPAVDAPAADDWDATRRRTVGGGVDEEVLTSIHGVRNREYAVE